MKAQEARIKESFLDLLVEKDLLSQEQAENLFAGAGKLTESKIREILLRRNLISEEKFYIALAEYLNLPYIDLRLTTFDPEALAMIPSEIARQNFLIPFAVYPGEISVAFDDPDLNIIQHLEKKTLCNILVHIASRSRIIESIEVQYGAIDIQTAANKVDFSKYDTKMLESREIAEIEPIVDISNGIITSAIRNRASDIHIEPRKDYLQIRFRIDGMMQERYKLNRRLAPPLVSRYKILADLDIAEKRIPQDGRIQYAVGERSIDIRVSTAPVVFGEKLVLRLLDKSGVNLDVEQMLFSKQIFHRIERMVSSPHGIFFVTGPTGCGKTTTLYAVINYINSIDKNIVTIEDPVEYQLPLINQIQVNPEVGLDFPRVLRSVLRQDPDVILVGEIRDLETAKIATEAALTGHLVLSTLHTNNAVDAVLRLVEIGVEAFMVAPSLIGVLAQRLVPRICQKCKRAYIASDEEKSYFELPTKESTVKLYRGKGCISCLGTGYSGRLAIHELIVVTDEIRELILQRAPSDRIAKAAYKVGYRSMRYDGLKKASIGYTTLDEVTRITTAQEDFL